MPAFAGMTKRPCGKNHIAAVVSATDAGARDGDKARVPRGFLRRLTMKARERSLINIMLMKAVAVMIAVMAAGAGTTAAVASGWTLAGLGMA